MLELRIHIYLIIATTKNQYSTPGESIIDKDN